MNLFVFVCVAAQFIVGNSKTLPALPEPCQKSDPNLKSCALKAIQSLIPHLAIGIPEYKISSVDPLNIARVVFSRTLNDMFVVNAILKDAKIVGFSQVTIDDLQVDAENLAGEITLKHPWFTLDTEFKFRGKIANAPVETEAYFSGNFTDVTNHFKASFKPIKKGGLKYYAVDQFKLDGTISHAQLNIVPKNPEDQPLVDFLLSTFSQNERVILDVFSPLYGDAMGDVLRSVLEKALSQVPAERILAE